MTKRVKKQVLVVDDDVVILRLVREALGALLGCEVDTTPNPEYAFELALRKQYDLLVFDYLLPNVDGPTLYALLSKIDTIRPAAERRLPPLLLMSGHAAQRRAQEFLREPGVHGLLAKPFSIERLVEKVGALLG